MNFVREFLAIQDYIVENELSANEAMLLLAVFRVLNDRFWPEGMVAIGNNQLLAKTTFTGSKRDDTLREARKRLAERGILRFVPGQPHVSLPCYCIAWDVLHPEDAPEVSPEHAPEVTPEVTPKNRGETGGEARGVIRGMDGGRGIYNNISVYPQNENRNGKGETKPPETVDEDELRLNELRARAREALTEQYPGAKIPEIWPTRLAVVAEECELDEKMLKCAIRAAARSGASSPVAYASTVMRDMFEHDDKTVKQYTIRRVREGYG